MMRQNLPPVILRRATSEDALTVLRWRNDPRTVSASLSQKAAPVDGHLRWWNNALNGESTVLLMLEDSGDLVGHLCLLNAGDKAWEVCVIVDPDERGQGYGGLALCMLAWFGQPDKYISYVRPQDLALQRVFAGAGFSPVGFETRDGVVVGRYERM